MNVLIFGGWTFSQQIKSLANGFQTTGHSILHLPYSGALEQPERLRAVVENHKPDLMIGFIAERLTNPQVLSETTFKGIPKLYWDFDLPQELMTRGREPLRTIIQHFDVSASICNSDFTKELFEGLTPIYWMPPVWDPLRKVGEPIYHKYLFIGTGEQFPEQDTPPRGNVDRANLMRRLKNDGIEVDCYGQFWPDDVVKGTVPYEEQWRHYKGADFNINSFAAIPPGRTKLLNFRSIFVTGSGGFLACHWHDGIEDCFVPGEEMLFWRNYDELKAILNDTPEEDRTRMAAAAEKRTLSQYSADVWAQNIVSWVKAL